jgi:hypothetical protein
VIAITPVIHGHRPNIAVNIKRVQQRERRELAVDRRDEVVVVCRYLSFSRLGL